MDKEVLRTEIQKRLSEIPPGTGVAPAKWNRFFRNWIVKAMLLWLATAAIVYFIKTNMPDRQSPSPTPPAVHME